jgi:hypothetical protein
MKAIGAGLPRNSTTLPLLAPEQLRRAPASCCALHAIGECRERWRPTGGLHGAALS